MQTKKTKLIALMLTVAIMCSMLCALPMTAADSGKCGDNLTWTLDDNGTLTISGTGDMWDYGYFDHIPWYKHRKKITDLYINNGLTCIKPGAFCECSALTNVMIPDSVTSIGYSAFSGCNNLTTIVIPDSVTSIGYSAFSGCNNLTTIVIPDSVTGIDRLAFSNTAYYNNSENWENGVLYIGNHLIGVEKSISGSYSIRNNTKTIVPGAFERCIGLTSITIPGSVDRISGGMFAWCDALTGITIQDGVRSIDAHAFWACSSLVNIVIPDSVTSVGDSAFYACSSLSSITIPDSVTSIGSGVFFDTAYYGNSDNWENGVLYIGNHLITVERSISGSYNIRNNTKTISRGAFSGCSSLDNIVIPDSVTSIGPEAFDSCLSLSSITIPDSLANIGWLAFNNTAYYNNSNNWENGVLYIGNHLIKAEKLIYGSYSIRRGTTTIAEEAFYHCDALKSVTIPTSVMNIGDLAFKGCSSITSVTILDGVTNIGNSSFENCPLLTIYGSEGSYAQKYANENKIRFVVGTIIGDKVFTDVKAGAWYIDAVQYALAHNLFNDTSPTTFAPDVAMTRGMLVQVLYNLEGKPALENKNIRFTDVKEKDWYADAVKWAATTGVVNGVTPTTFEPNGNITREQMTTILYRYANLKKYDVSTSAALTKFPDGNKVSSYAVDSLKWAVGAGLISGNKIGGVDMLDARGNATRAQVAKIFMNFSKLAK